MWVLTKISARSKIDRIKIEDVRTHILIYWINYEPGISGAVLEKFGGWCAQFSNLCTKGLVNKVVSCKGWHYKCTYV